MICENPVGARRARRRNRLDAASSRETDDENASCPEGRDERLNPRLLPASPRRGAGMKVRSFEGGRERGEINET
jgi:hypothetical protein